MAPVAIFLRCYLLTVIPAPDFKRYGERLGIVAFVDGVTTGAIGRIAGAVIVLGQRSILDISTALVGLATLALFWRWRLPVPLLVPPAGAVGVVLYPLAHR